MAITNSELTRQVGAKVGEVPHLHVIVSAVFEMVAKNLANGDEVAIKNFGVFKVIEQEERVRRNPQTGEKFIIPARQLPILKASKTFISEVNRNVF